MKKTAIKSLGRDFFITFLVMQMIGNCFCAVTKEQMIQAGKMMRDICQPKFKVSDELADGIKEGKFPNDTDFKCYVNCMLEMMQMVKKGKFNYEASLKQIDLMLPEEMKEPTRQSVNICKDSAKNIKNNCDASYEILQCNFKNNPTFMFP